MVLDEQMVILNKRFALKLNLRHGISPLMRLIPFYKESKLLSFKNTHLGAPKLISKPCSILQARKYPNNCAICSFASARQAFSSTIRQFSTNKSYYVSEFVFLFLVEVEASFWG